MISLKNIELALRDEGVLARHDVTGRTSGRLHLSIIKKDGDDEFGCLLLVLEDGTCEVVSCAAPLTLAQLEVCERAAKVMRAVKELVLTGRLPSDSLASMSSVGVLTGFR